MGQRHKMKKQAHQKLASLAIIIILQSSIIGRVLSAEQHEGYLIPILSGGPNNQKRDLRHMLGLARELNRKVILTGLYKHYIDTGYKAQKRDRLSLKQGNGAGPCFANHTLPGSVGYMPTEKLLDTDDLARTFEAYTVDQVKAQGWNGKIDAVVVHKKFEDLFHDTVEKVVKTMNITYDGAPLFFPLRTWTLQCNPEAIEALKQALKPYKYAASFRVLLGRHNTPDLVQENVLEVNKLIGCRKSMAEAARALKPSPWIQKIASDFIQSHFKGKEFLCMQVRPYPDTCLQAWKNHEFVAGERLSGTCYPALERLHDRVGPCASKISKELELNSVFVMSHPMILPKIVGLLNQAGMHNIAYLDASHIEDLVGCIDHSATFLASIEESICLQAKAFIGTHTSSVSQSIGFMRLGLGNRQNLYFENLKKC